MSYRLAEENGKRKCIATPSKIGKAQEDYEDLLNCKSLIFFYLQNIISIPINSHFSSILEIGFPTMHEHITVCNYYIICDSVGTVLVHYTADTARSGVLSTPLRSIMNSSLMNSTIEVNSHRV